MKTLFKKDQGVVVTEPDHPLRGRTGRVWRLRFCDDGAWVQINGADIGHALARFPQGDSRRNHVVLFPEQCESL